MLREIIMMSDTFLIPVNFVCHLIIFLGGSYIAIHSRKIPTWLRTCLWYIGCSSFLIAITIILEWTLGQQFELSYYKIGIVAEILFNFWIAITTLVFFIKTIYSDIKFSKLRKLDD